MEFLSRDGSSWGPSVHSPLVVLRLSSICSCCSRSSFAPASGPGLSDQWLNSAPSEAPAAWPAAGFVPWESSPAPGSPRPRPPPSPQSAARPFLRPPVQGPLRAALESQRSPSEPSLQISQRKEALSSGPPRSCTASRWRSACPARRLSTGRERIRGAAPDRGLRTRIAVSREFPTSSQTASGPTRPRPPQKKKGRSLSGNELILVSESALSRRKTRRKLHSVSLGRSFTPRSVSLGRNRGSTESD